MSNGTQPTLKELFGRYLENQKTAHATGLASFDPSVEVTPYDAGPVQPIDPSAAWSEATVVISQFAPEIGVESISAPPNWPALVNAQEPAVAVAFCVGNYPQLVRNLHQILALGNVESLRPMAGRALESENLTNWVEEVCGAKHMPDLLFAVGALRLAKQPDKAAAIFERYEDAIPEKWRVAWENERAALEWHRGETEKALTMWEKQSDTVPVLFNRGMAALFVGKNDTARQALSAAVAKLPEGTSWHHLGQLYLAMAN